MNYSFLHPLIIPATHTMKINLQDSTTITWIIILAIIFIAIGYSGFAIQHQPTQMSFTVDENYKFPYQLQEDEWRVEVPPALKEISGITPLGKGSVLAINDEKGILYSVDLNAGNIITEIPFDKDRDYEDLCKVANQVFILERDGDLYQFDLETQDSVIKFETIFNYRNDTEGICFDAKNNRLLISHKEGAPEGVVLPKNTMCVFGFDLLKKTVSPVPIISIAQKEIGRIVGNGGKPYNFKPSAIGIHPHSGNLYILSSVGKILIIVNPINNKILHVELLNEQSFPQPEGLCFDENENLLISSEGIDQSGFIAKFKGLPHH